MPPVDPIEFFIFVSRASFLARHNYAVTGAFVSSGFGAAYQEEVPIGTVSAWGAGPDAETDTERVRARYAAGTLDCMPYVTNTGFYGWTSPFAENVSSDYRVEYDAEWFRRDGFRLAPSRMSATFAFGDYSTCETVAARHGWPLESVKKFRLRPHAANRVARVNMEIVSLARTAYRRASWDPAHLRTLWASYWSGLDQVSVEVPVDGYSFETLTSGVIWEFLVEGVLERCDP